MAQPEGFHEHPPADLPDWGRPLPFRPRRQTPLRSIIMAITKVWIEEGCIVCNACETTCPEVFNVTEDSCHIRAEVRVDGTINTNLPGKSPLKGTLGADLADQIIEAAEGCPVEVIKYEKT
jgi:ferredoxin